MAGKQSTHAAHMSTTILRSATYFPVPDVAASGSYYRRVFGFRCEYAAGDPPEFAIYSRDACVVMLRRAAAGSALVPNERQGGTWDLFCWVEDVDAIHRELVAHGADVVYPPTLQPYGMRELAVRDPDGYVLGFGSEASGG